MTAYTVVGAIALLILLWFLTGNKNSYYMQSRKIFDNYISGLQLGENIPFQIALDYAAVQYGEAHNWPSHGHQIAVNSALDAIASGKTADFGMNKFELGVFMILETDLRIQQEKGLKITDAELKKKLSSMRLAVTMAYKRVKNKV